MDAKVTLAWILRYTLPPVYWIHHIFGDPCRLRDTIDIEAWPGWQAFGYIWVALLCRRRSLEEFVGFVVHIFMEIKHHHCGPYEIGRGSLVRLFVANPAHCSGYLNSLIFILTLPIPLTAGSVLGAG